jgi:hypothetical protein
LPGSQQDLQQLQQQYDPSQQQQYYNAQQQYYQQYDPSMQQQYMQYDPSMQQQYAQYDPNMQHYDPSMRQATDMQYVQQYEQHQQHQQQQQVHKLKLQTKSKLGFDAAPQETRYTATGRVQRAASKGIARLIAEEGGVPQDHSFTAPPPMARYAWASPGMSCAQAVRHVKHACPRISPAP